MSTRRPFSHSLGLYLAATLTLVGCQPGESSNPDDEFPEMDVAERTDAERGDAAERDAADADVDLPDAAADTDGLPPSVSEQVIHKFDDYTLEAGEETIPCVQWSLNNDDPVYVNTVTMSNGGGFHHSNWYVVPEDYAAGPDGYFDCDERGYRGFTAATKGTVLFAQSTQAKSEVQQFPPGVVTKIPPNHKIVADLHFLNIKPRKFTTSARLTLGLVHPKDVDTIATPFVLTYDDLKIPPKSETRFTAECGFADQYKTLTNQTFDMELYYVLPHYHGLGNYFDLEIFGGPNDGDQLFQLQGFDAEANGQEFDPPLEISDAKGFRFSCGYDNPRDEVVDWGIGGDEMCMMLLYGNQDAMMAGRITETNETRKKDGIIRKSGPCNTTALPPSDGQTMPTDEEKSGEMYVPESNTTQKIEPIPDCKPRPETAEPYRDPTLTNLETDLFSVGCAFTSCHDGEKPASGLNLTADDLHEELMNHKLSTPTDMPLVDPGNPDNSWLYEVTSECKPESSVGPVSHMPRNSPTLLDPPVLAMVREWIEQGAKDN